MKDKWVCDSLGRKIFDYAWFYNYEIKNIVQPWSILKITPVPENIEDKYVHNEISSKVLEVDDEWSFILLEGGEYLSTSFVRGLGSV